MGAVGPYYQTLQQWARTLDPKGGVADVVEILNQSNEVLDDMIFREGNLPTGHRTTVRTGLPTVYWRLLNQGVPPSTDQTAQVDEQCGMLEAWSVVDKALAELNGNSSEYRLSRAKAFIEAMNQQMASTLFYGNSGVNPEQFLGLAPRYSALTGAANSENILAGTEDASANASIWLIVWGENTVHGIFPKGSQIGLERKDWGLSPIQVLNTLSSPTVGIGSGRLEAYQEHFTWKLGLSVEDWRFAGRICNIGTTKLVANSGMTDLYNKMQMMVHRIPNFNAGKAAWYMNRTVRMMLDVQARDAVKAGGSLTYEYVDGRRITKYQEIPIRLVDALTNTEETVA